MIRRFVDLSVRSKFLITLAIPVLGLVLLIGRQLVGSIDRQNVLTYFRDQSVYLGQLTTAIDALQDEKTAAYALLSADIENLAFLRKCDRTDSLVVGLTDPVNPLDTEIEKDALMLEIQGLRSELLNGKAGTLMMINAYEEFEHELISELGRVGKLALYPDTKDRLYAHLSLVTAKDALSSLNLRVNEFLLKKGTSADDRVQVVRQSGAFETSIRLFERDASQDILEEYHDSFSEEEFSLLRSLLSIMRERAGVILIDLSPKEWAETTTRSLTKLEHVQALSLHQVIKDNNDLLDDAERRLIFTVIALLLVVFSVSVLGYLLTKTIRQNVNELGEASGALAIGDVRGKVPVRSNDEFGQLAKLFNSLIDNIRSLSRSAEMIGKGDYDTPVTVRSSEDTLGLSLSRMRDNLRAAKVRDEEQGRILQDEKEKLEEANENVKILIKEIHHRVKNNLQVIVSLLRLQGMNITDPTLQDAFDQTQARVRSMALIHEKLYQGADLAQVDVRKYFEELFDELVQVNNLAERVKYEIDLPEGFELDLNTMVPVGLIMNELITNSFKHAFKGRDSGRVQLEVRTISEGRFELTYSDNGVGLPEGFDPKEITTLGVVLIDSLVEQLNGTLQYDSNEEGTNTRILFGAA